MLKKFLFIALLSLSACLNTNAQIVIGKYAGEFMAIGVGGRPSGMGGAFAAIANDVTAAYWNPAGLAQLNYPQISLMHDEHFGNLVNYNYAAVGLPYGPDMTFAVTAIRLGIDGIPDTRKVPPIYDVNGDGILDIGQGDRPDPSYITEFSAADYAFYFSFAKRHSDKFFYGANAKIIYRKIAEFSATGIGFDIGAIYTPFERFAVAASLQDITTTLVAWSTGRNELITPTAKLGTAYSFNTGIGRFTPALDVDVRFENRRYASQFKLGPVSFDPRGGVEYSYNDVVAVRLGYNDVKEYTVGAGIKLPKLNIDYSFSRFSGTADDRLGDNHRISLILTLQEKRFERKTLVP